MPSYFSPLLLFVSSLYHLHWLLWLSLWRPPFCDPPFWRGLPAHFPSCDPSANSGTRPHRLDRPSLYLSGHRRSFCNLIKRKQARPFHPTSASSFRKICEAVTCFTILQRRNSCLQASPFLPSPSPTKRIHHALHTNRYSTCKLLQLRDSQGTHFPFSASKTCVCGVRCNATQRNAK
jgi:hypothetical protein